MARDYAARWPVPPVRGTLLVAAAVLFAAGGVRAEKVRVDEELEAYPTESVDLRCQFVDGGGRTKLTQVSWIWEPVDGQRDNIAVYHPIYGQSFPNQFFKDRVVFLHNSLENPSIRISNLKMSDAGRYTCEYATYPSGNEQGTTTLIMLAKPRNSAKVVTVQAGTKSVVVAQCEAAEGKPAATIKWLASVGGNHSSSTTNGPDGTVTVRSEYRLVPTAADNGREVTCMVEQRTQERPWAHTVRLSVEYPPSVSIEGYDNNWYVGRSDAMLVCVANSNPAPTTITWTSASGPLPETVVVDGNKLTVRKVNDAVNTTFTCEVKNKHGASRHQITTIVIEALEDPSSAGVVAGAVIGSLLALLLVVGLISVLLTRSRRQQRRGYPSSGDSIATGSGGSNGGDYGNKARLLFSGTGNNSSKNGTSANNNGPIYTYREGCDATGTLTEKANEYHHHHLHHTSSGNAPSSHDILLSGEMGEAERRKFDLDDSMEDEEERYDRFGGVGGGADMLPPAYQVRRGHGNEEEMDVYLDDDMESQRDEEKRQAASGPPTGGVIGGIFGFVVLICLLIAIACYIRKRQEDGEGPPKHKPPPPVKAGSSTEMLNKPSGPPTATETDSLSPGEVYYEPTGGEPVTSLDEDTTGALNGGAPPVRSDTDGHRGNDLDPSNQPAPASISRGESFVSPAMYV